MVDTSLIRPECLYESAEACELCGRTDVKSFIAAIVRAGHKPSAVARGKLWQGTTLLAFLGVGSYRPQEPEISDEEAFRRLRAHRPKSKRKAVA
jgi:hypothetical protein